VSEGILFTITQPIYRMIISGLIMNFLRKFYALGKIGFKTSLAYRFEFMSSIVISPLILVMMYFVWSAIYQNNSSSLILGYSFQDMITYYVIVLIIGHFIYNNVGNDLQQKIVYGDLNQDLLKPVSILTQFVAREFAKRTFALFVEFIPISIIALILFRINIPTLFYFLAFAVSLLFAFVINFLLGFFTGLLAFWIQNIGSIQWLMFIAVRFLSGEFIPLEFLGSYFSLSKLLPFYYLRYGLAQIFIGATSANETVLVLLMQLVWIAILYIGINIVLRIALKKFGAEGG